MTHMVRIRYLLLTLFFGAFAFLQASAQMKIGNHPTQIQPASILELESNNQALRLTQGDTAQVNLIIAGETTLPDGETPSAGAEGMIMYQLSDKNFYIRKNGYWNRILTSNNENQYFQLGGNSLTKAAGTDTSAFLGLNSAGDTLKIGTNGIPSVIIAPTGVINMLDSLNAVLARVNKLYSGVAKIDTLTVNDSLNVANKFTVNNGTSTVSNIFVMKDSVMMTNLMNAFGADTALLSIGPGGVVHKMSIDSLLASNKPTINGINSTVFHLRFGTDSSRYTPWIDSTSLAIDSVLIFNIPDASMHARGLVDTVAQTFQGAKTFANSVAIGTPTSGTLTAPNSTLQVNGNVSMADTTTTQNINMANGAGDRFRTIICDVSSAPSGTGIGVTLPAAVDGRIYTFKKIGSTSDGQLSSPVTITTLSGNIDGDTNTFKIYNNFTSVTLQAQGASGWVIIGH